MASYKIKWKLSAQKEVRKLGQTTIPKIVEAVASLSQNPFPAGSIKLRGSERAYRIRVGSYRVVYSVYADILLVEVVRVGHRKDVYRKAL